MKNIVIGRYIPGKGFLYDMDPRTKIIALIILMVSAFLIRDFSVMLIGVFAIVVLLLLGRINIKRVYLGLRPLMFLLIFTFTFQLMFNTQGAIVYDTTLVFSWATIALAIAIGVFWFYTKRYIPFKLLYFLLAVYGIFSIFASLELGPTLGTRDFAIHEQGLETAFFIMMRLIIIVTLSTILTITTKPTDLNLGLESVLKPFKVLRLNTEEMAMIIAISLRYIPTLLDEANKIMMAQASRGADFTEGKLKDKVGQIVSLLVPMFIISFKRSDELANAMEARSFVPGAERTRLHLLKWKTVDTMTIVSSLVIAAAIIVYRVMA